MKICGEPYPRTTQHRSVCESVCAMEEIVKFLQSETGGSEMLNGAAHLYEEIARDYANRADQGRIALLSGFLEQGAQQEFITCSGVAILTFGLAMPMLTVTIFF